MTERILKIMQDIADYREKSGSVNLSIHEKITEACFMDIANQLAYLNDQIELVRKYGITTYRAEV